MPNSLGWSWNGPPSESQFWLPLTGMPMPGTWTSTSRKTVPSEQRIGERAVQLRTGSRAAVTSSTAPIAAASSCLRKK